MPHSKNYAQSLCSWRRVVPLLPMRMVASALWHAAVQGHALGPETGSKVQVEQLRAFCLTEVRHQRRGRGAGSGGLEVVIESLTAMLMCGAPAGKRSVFGQQ